MHNGVDTPSLTRAPLQLNTKSRSGAPAFNPHAFALPALGALGTARDTSSPGRVPLPRGTQHHRVPIELQVPSLPLAESANVNGVSSVDPHPF